MNDFQSTMNNEVQRPYAVTGSGALVSSLWKHGDAESGWYYRFNVYRMCPHTGQVSQLLRPEDLFSLLKLNQVLAAVLAEDGCLSACQRASLAELATRLDSIIARET